MIETPIVDFIDNYKNSGFSRFHMPGHKGNGNAESLDITEINGADSLYEANGIIYRSQQNAKRIFNTKATFYSTEGSSQCIKAMIFLALTLKTEEMSNTIVAARNVHKAFVHAAALCDIDVNFVYPKENEPLLSCSVTPKQLDETLRNLNKKPFAVYITSPDYLGGIADIKGLSDICKNYNIPLLVDNAHGAYLNFLENHPTALGADMCCDSAHKTLPCLTGAAYLHIMNEKFIASAKKALALFGSTSPSYLILRSLDKANKYLSNNYKEKLIECIEKVNKLKSKFDFIENSEPLKIVINANKAGTTGFDFASFLRKNKVECEYSDNTYVVLMFTPSNNESDFKRLETTLSSFKTANPISAEYPALNKAKRVMSIKEAVFAQNETINVNEALGRVCADITVSCPPAVPIAISGEVITQNEIDLFSFYNIEKVCVVKSL